MRGAGRRRRRTVPANWRGRRRAARSRRGPGGGPRRPDLLADLAAGRALADLDRAARTAAASADLRARSRALQARLHGAPTPAPGPPGAPAPDAPGRRHAATGPRQEDTAE
jgi:hypothetical protein